MTCSIKLPFLTGAVMQVAVSVPHLCPSATSPDLASSNSLLKIKACSVLPVSHCHEHQQQAMFSTQNLTPHVPVVFVWRRDVPGGGRSREQTCGNTHGKCEGRGRREQEQEGKRGRGGVTAEASGMTEEERRQ